MAAKPLPPQDVLRSALSYEPVTGHLYWKANDAIPHTPARKPGSRALGYITERGYYRGGLLGRQVMAHRVVWKWHYGTEPDEIDHVDGDKTNNRIENLRAATRQDNVRNTSIRKTNKSGVQGVYWHAAKRAWIASIRTAGRQVHLGKFATLDDAAACRKLAEREYGYHPNHGRRQ